MKTFDNKYIYDKVHSHIDLHLVHKLLEDGLKVGKTYLAGE